MTSTVQKTSRDVAVGSRVSTRYSVDREGDRSTWPLESGRIVEDFAASVEPGSVSREWAVAHRWAVALDNGCLVFRDSSELEDVASDIAPSESSAGDQ